MDNEAFVRIWTSWLTSADFEAHIKAHFLERKPFIELLKKYVRKCHGGCPKVLEVGCGTAIDSYVVAHNTDADVWASDISQEAIELARKVGTFFDKRINLAVENALHLSFVDKTFDLVFSQGLVEHFPDPLPVLKEQLRVLKDSGYLIVDVPQRFNPYTIFKHKEMEKGVWEYGWETEYSYWDLKRLGKRLGLATIEVSANGYGHSRDYGLSKLRLLGSRFKDDYGASAFLARLYDSFWGGLEKRFGHYFMQSISIVYQRQEAIESEVKKRAL